VPQDDEKWPDWLVKQRGKAYRAPGYMSRRLLIREWVSHLKATDCNVTHSAIRNMLLFVDRGYSLKPDQISFALKGHYRSGAVPKMPNGRPVMVDGEAFLSARAAAARLRVSPQTVLNRIASSDERWSGWRLATDGHNPPSSLDKLAKKQ
jgi:hypothetical protein